MVKEPQKVHQVVGLDPNLVDKAVGALLKHHHHQQQQQQSSDDANNKKTKTSLSLFGNDESIHVQFSLARMPDASSLTSSSRPIRIDIPHSLHKLNTNKDDDDNDEDMESESDNLEEAEICLIVKDASKPAIQQLASQFPNELSHIKKILSLTSLRKKYASYSDRRNLCSSYNLFLVDDSILPMVGKCIGKTFFMKKKQPVPVKLGRVTSLPFVIEKCVRSTFLVNVGVGTCVSVK